MVAQLLMKGALLRRTRDHLALPPNEIGVDLALFAAALRRAASIIGPCSRSTLSRRVAESLSGLVAEDALLDRLDEAIEALVVGGDLLEASDVASGDPNVRATWVFPAPLAFVMTRGGAAFFVGMTRDAQGPLSETLRGRVTLSGAARIIRPEPEEKLAETLATLGVPQITESAWLKAPKAETATEHLQGMMRKLALQGPSGVLPDLKILDPTKSATFYKGRWTTVAGKHNGILIARRPQAYGADLWGLARVEKGECRAFLDFPFPGSRWRGCDVAWHLQMAIDAGHDTPQVYRRVDEGASTRFDFFSPLPLWAQRRFTVIGASAPGQRSLMSFSVPVSEGATEEQFLQDRLWLANADDGGGA